ncbi:MAG TPA: hypothetical protein VFV01_00825 [Spirillospora sp.]|nr:hypothetical protein [Spirillospora sp.]
MVVAACAVRSAAAFPRAVSRSRSAVCSASRSRAFSCSASVSRSPCALVGVGARLGGARHAAAEFAHRKSGRTPALNDYAHMRQHTAAGAATLAFTEIIDGEEIPPEEMESPAVRALAEIATAAFDDDLFSYGKEMWQAARTKPSPCQLNLPDIPCVEHSLAPGRALERATELCNRLTLRFLQLRDQVLPGAGRPLRRYTEHLTRLIPGNLEWGLQAGRYTNPDGPGAVAAKATFTGTPPSTARPPIPSIAWWWASGL